MLDTFLLVFSIILLHLSVGVICLVHPLMIGIFLRFNTEPFVQNAQGPVIAMFRIKSPGETILRTTQEAEVETFLPRSKRFSSILVLGICHTSLLTCQTLVHRRSPWHPDSVLPWQL